ncbi:MAG: hypothetical protein D8H99_23225 [Streptococcus sp.]|nr:MAG: hypothetical protein D8H99_23225 [Streptococcus sp.]
MSMKEITYYNLKEWDYYKNDKKALMDLAEHGFFIDEILALKDPQLTENVVYYGHASKYYTKLKDSEFEPVRYIIARTGFFPEHFINDKSDRIRGIVIGQNPKYLEQFIYQDNTETQTDFPYIYEGIRMALGNVVSPNKEYLKAFLTKPLSLTESNEFAYIQFVGRDYLKAFTSKLASYSYSMPKNQSVYEAYKANNPAYAQTLTSFQVGAIQYVEKYQEITSEEFFNKILTYQPTDIFEKENMMDELNGSHIQWDII